jgi:hypothetical protein
VQEKWLADAEALPAPDAPVFVVSDDVAEAHRLRRSGALAAMHRPRCAPSPT